jgi:predicted GIY-YIG superfamily endonuclease
MLRYPARDDQSPQPIQFYEDPEMSCSWSSPLRNYEYERSAENPNFWVAVRVKSAEEMDAEEAAERKEKLQNEARTRARAKGDTRRTALYRLRDAEGLLLYIGISARPYQRWIEHAADKAWWAEVSDLSIEWFESRAEAMAMEAHAIKTEKPRHNLQHNQAAA